MTQSRFVILLISFFLVYTQGLWERLTDYSPAIKLIIEISIWLYFFVSLRYFKKWTHTNLVFILLLIFSFSTAIVNGSGLNAWLKYIRYFVYFYLLFISLWHTQLTSGQWLTVLKFAVFLILIQGLGSAYNILILNERVEGYVGLMSSLGGTTAATFPLLIVSLSVLLYFFNPYPSTRFYFYLLACVVSAFLVGYSSEKRAIFFTIPAFWLIITVISAIFLKTSRKFYKRSLILVGIVLVLLPVYIFGIRTTQGVNYYLSGNETNRQMVINAFEYAVNYEESKSFKGLTTGRSGSSVQIIRNSTKNVEFFMFGQGFGMVKDDNTLSRLGIDYGIVGFTRDIISGGWIVMFLTVLIMLNVILINKSIRNAFTTTLRITILLVFLFTHFVYSSDFTISLKINFLLVFLLVFINSPMQSEYLKRVLSEYVYHPED